MKKLVLSGALLLAFSAAFVACEKEEVKPVVSSTVNDTDAPVKAGTRKVWFDEGGSNYGCKGSGGNCLDEVVARLQKYTLLNEIGTCANNNQNALVIAKFIENYADLSSLISTDVLDDVINGVATLKVKGTVSSSSTAYFLFTKAGNIYSVQPIK